jgi:hypothetical protein
MRCNEKEKNKKKKKTKKKKKYSGCLIVGGTVEGELFAFVVLRHGTYAICCHSHLPEN